LQVCDMPLPQDDRAELGPVELTQNA